MGRPFTLNRWFFIAVIAGFAALVGLLSTINEAPGQGVCRTDAQWDERLRNNHKERPIIMGLLQERRPAFFRLYANDDTDTWTLVIFSLPSRCSATSFSGNAYTELFHIEARN
jgi:hypothetical protein